MLDLDKIEAAARAATVWECQEHGEEHWYECDKPGPHNVDVPWNEVVDCDVCEDCMPQTHAFLTTCSPDVILELIGRLRKLEQEREDAFSLALERDVFE